MSHFSPDHEPLVILILVPHFSEVWKCGKVWESKDEDISWIRKDAERQVLGALGKFHDRRVERSRSRLVKLEQESRKEKRKDISDKVPANTLEFSHEQKLENIQKKIDELNKMKYVLQNAKENKQSESYPRVFSENIDYLKRERGKKKRSLSTKKRNERRRKIARDLDKNITEARKKHIKNLSDYKMTCDQINTLSDYSTLPHLWEVWN